MANSHDFLLLMVKSIVLHPNMVFIDRSATEKEMIYVIRTAKDDVGIVIGKNGAIINAMRSIIHVMGHKESMRISLRVLE